MPPRQEHPSPALPWFAVAFLTIVIGLGCTQAFCAESGRGTLTRHGVKIASLPLDEALQEFAHQSGVQVVFFSRLTQGLRAPELTGEYTVAEAMERLLANSGLSFRIVNAQTVEVRQASAVASSRSRATPRSRASAVTPEEIEEVLVMGTAEQLVATRVPTPLREIPQSISIVSAEQIREQDNVDLSDVMRDATGAVLRRRSSMDADIYVRGFRVTAIHVDGGAAMEPDLPEPTALASTPDLSEFDHVEILRGSDSLFAGNSNPGGTVSLVRKRPLSNFQARLTASVGSWSARRFEADITGPLVAGGALRGRVDAMYSDTDYFYDTASFERKKIFGVLEYDVTSRGTLTAGASYQWDDAVPWEGGLPFFEDGGDIGLPRRTALTFDWALNQTRTSEAYLQYRQPFSDDWNFRFNAATWHPKIDYAFAVFFSPLDRQTQRLFTPTAFFTEKPSVYTQDTVDVTLTGTFDAFGLREEIAIGADYRRMRGRWYPSNASFGTRRNVRDFDPSAYPDPRTGRTIFLRDGSTNLKQHGVFGSVRVPLSDAWAITGGARFATDYIENTVLTTVGTRVLGPSTARASSSEVFTPFVGLMYRMNDRYSWYASYADIYSSNAISESTAGRLIGPAHGVNIETGIKAAWRDGAVNGSLALYRILQSDLPVEDLNATEEDLDRSPFCCSVSRDARSRGAELETSGELRPGWLVGAGYTYNVGWYPLGQNRPLVAPRHLLKAWTSRQLPGELSRWTVGGSLEAQGRTLTKGDFSCSPGECPDVIQKSYVVLDLRTAFQIDRSWQVALSLNNVFDRTYYDSIEPFEQRGFYGAPRNFTLRVDAAF
jgi:outer membrane receptor for ferric coprogen and ferric-rhodotorulic acid